MEILFAVAYLSICSSSLKTTKMRLTDSCSLSRLERGRASHSLYVIVCSIFKWYGILSTVYECVAVDLRTPKTKTKTIPYEIKLKMVG